VPYGADSADALDRAVLLYCVYVGYTQTAHVAPYVISADMRQRHLRLVFDALADAAIGSARPDLADPPRQ
jgi:hypothetical protein